MPCETALLGTLLEDARAVDNQPTDTQHGLGVLVELAVQKRHVKEERLLIMAEVGESHHLEDTLVTEDALALLPRVVGVFHAEQERRAFLPEELVVRRVPGKYIFAIAAVRWVSSKVTPGYSGPVRTPLVRENGLRGLGIGPKGISDS